jgi:hypothetical protein
MTDLARRLGRDEKGGALIYMAILAPLLVGFAGLAVDTGVWFSSARSMQTIADAAAVAGVLERRRTGGDAAIVAAATENAELNGFDASSGQTITVNWPPASGPFTGNLAYVEAIVTKPENSLLGHHFMPNSVTSAKRSVAGSFVITACVWALNPTSRSALTVNGGATVNLGCGVMVNSTDSEALTQVGTSCLTAVDINIAGDYSGSCVSPAPDTNTNAFIDPMAHFSVPPPGGCTSNANIRVSAGETLNLSPGVYCGNLSVASDATLNLVPNSPDDNMFVLDGSAFSVAGQATVFGDGVFIYMTDANGPAAAWTISGGADVDLTAAVAGPYAGILFYMDRNSPANRMNTLAGGATQTMNGLIYTPNNDLNYSGVSTFYGAGSGIIADEISFVGDSDITGFINSTVETNEDLYFARIVE